MAFSKADARRALAAWDEGVAVRARAPRPVLRGLPRTRRGPPAHLRRRARGRAGAVRRRHRRVPAGRQRAAARSSPWPACRRCSSASTARRRGDAARRAVARAVELPPRSRARRARRPGQPRRSATKRAEELTADGRGARPRRRRRLRPAADRGRPPRPEPAAAPGAARRPEPARGRGAAPRRRRPDHGRDRDAAVHLDEDRRAPHPAHLHEDRRRRTAPRRPAGRSSTRSSTAPSPADRPAPLPIRCAAKWVGLPMPRRRLRPENDAVRRSNPVGDGSAGSIERENAMILATTTVEDVDRFLECSAPRAPRSARSTAPRARPCSATRPRRTGSGRCSTGTRRAGRASSPTPRCPPILKEAGHVGKPQAAHARSAPTRREEDDDDATPSTDPARVGLITDQTGALSFMGIANANVAKMVIDDINAARRPPRSSGRAVHRGQRDRRRAWRRPWRRSSSSEWASTSSSAASTARPARPSRARWSTRRETLYIYPEQYEGQECHPLIFCTGPVPAQQVEPFFPWLMQRDRGEDASTCRRPTTSGRTRMNKKVREVVTRRGRRDRRRGVLPARPHWTTSGSSTTSWRRGAEVVFNTIVPPGLTPFLEQLHRRRLHGAGRARSSAPTSTRTS